MSTTAIGTITGHLNIQGDHDWIKAILSGNTLYAITTDLEFPFASMPLGQLAVYDDKGLAVGRADSNGSALGFMPVNSGVYYIDVSSFFDVSSFLATDSYTLSLASSPDDFANNTTTSGVIAVGGTPSGVINIPGDHDWLKTSLLKANTLYAITSDTADATLAVYDASGNAVGKLDASGKALGFMPADSGTYYVDISTGTTTGNYTLNLVESADDFANNTTTVGTIAVGSTKSGVINVPGDHDWLKTSLTANTLYDIDSDAAGTFLTIFDAGGKSVGKPDASGSTLGFMPASSGTYYIDIGSSKAGNYTLNLAASTDDFANNPTTTGNLPVNGNMSGTLNVKGDHDWLKTSLTANTLYAITSNSGSAFLTLYDASGNAVAKTDAYGTALGFMPASSGTYYIDISSYSDSGAYTLNLAAVNDDFSNNPGTSGAVAVGGSVSGTFNVEGDHDWLKTTLDANTLYEITSDSDSALLMVYDASGNAVGKSDATGLALGFMPVSSGTYYIDISSYSATGAYKLSVATSSDDFANNLTTQGKIETGVVLDSNHAPVVKHEIADQTATEDTSFNFTIPADSFSDADTGDKLSYTASLVTSSGVTIGTGALPSWLAFDATARKFSGTPANSDVGLINLKVTATDSHAASVSDVFTLNTINVNDAPEASDVSASGSENAASVKVTLQGTDVDSAVQYQLFSLPANGSLFSDSQLTHKASLGNAFPDASLYFVPNAQWDGTTSFSYKATDGTLSSALKTATINIAAVNQAPVANNVSVNGQEDAHAINIKLSASDDKGPLSYLLTSLPNNGVLYGNAELTSVLKLNTSIASDAVYFVPKADWNGQTSFNYKATDGVLASEIKTVSIAVAAVNDTPTGSVELTGTAAPGNTLTLSNTLTDADGLGSMSYQWLRSGDLIQNAQGVSYAVTQSDAGQSLSVLASYTDGNGTHESISSNTVFILPIVNVNSLPIKGTVTGASGLSDDVFDDTRVPNVQKLSGGKGNDSYIIHNTLTKILEGSNQGLDTVYSDVSFTLANNLERLILLGKNAIDGTGNASDNLLVGNAGNNQLNGQAGNDLLTGGAGKDVFVFNAALNAKKNVDTITDFKPGEDVIALSSKIFKKLGPTVDTSELWFKDAGSPQTQTGFLVYDSTTGVLAYDADGSGKKPAVQIALIGVEPHPELQAADFVII